MQLFTPKNNYSRSDFFLELKQSLNISLPIIIAQFVYALNGFIATAFIAHLGKNELATNALVWGIFITLLLFFIGILNASSILIAQRNGAKDLEGMREILSAGLLLAILAAIPSITALLCGSKLLASLGQHKEIVALSGKYFRSLAYSILPIYILVTIQQFLLGLGKTRLVLFISIVEVPMQLFLFYSFVLGGFHSHQYGLSGIGYGITLVVAFWAIVMGIYLRHAKPYSKYKIFSNIFTCKKAYLKELVKVGLPLGFMYWIEVALFTACAILMGRISRDALAAHQIAHQCFIAAIVLIFGFSQGTTIRASYEIGRNDKNTMLLTCYVHLLVCVTAAICIAIFYIIFTKTIIGLDINVNDVKYASVVAYAQKFLGISCILLIIESIRGIAIGALRALQQTKTIMYVSLLTFWFVAFPAAYLFAFPFAFGGAGVWWGIVTGISTATLILSFKVIKIIKNINLQTIQLNL